MGNNVFLPLFSVIRSFILVCFFESSIFCPLSLSVLHCSLSLCSVGVFFSPVRNICRPVVFFSMPLDCVCVSFTKMWSRFIYHWPFEHNARSHIGSHVDALNESFIFLFFVFSLSAFECKEKCCVVLCWTDVYRPSQRANKQLKHTGKRFVRRKKKPNVLLLEPIE